MRLSQIKEVSATGDVSTDDSNLRAVTLTGGSAAATLTVKRGGSGGTTVLTVKAAIDTTVSVADLHDGACAGGIHATLTGTGAVATFVYS